MAFDTTCISRVRATVFPMGRQRDGQVVALPGLLLLSWHSVETNKFFQAYVNGELAGSTIHTEQRMLLVEHDPSTVALVEVVAVDPAEQYRDFSDQLSGFTAEDGCHVELSWPRRGILPLNSRVEVYADDCSGAIDYDAEPLASSSVWDDPLDKWGWGFDVFGKGDFGYSGTGAPGWGHCGFGDGEFGFDAERCEWQSDCLTLGVHHFGVRLTDGAGNPNSGGDSELAFHIDPVPQARQIGIEDYDAQSNVLVLRVS